MNFYKYNGLGNDFIIVNCMGEAETPLTEKDEIVSICNRRLEVGADGVINVLDSEIADVKMLFFNSDGSHAELCGNAVRCLAKFVYDNDYIKKSSLKIETDAGIILVHIEEEFGFMKSAEVNMGYAFAPDNATIPLVPAEGIERILLKDIKLANFVKSEQHETDKKLSVNGNFYFINMGVPHVVIFMNDISDELVCLIGPLIEEHSIFKNGTNVDFAKILSRNEIEMKTWERGAGFTMACGTGACATQVVARLTSQTDECANLILPGGKLVITMKEDGQVFLDGPASFSYKGSWDRNNIEMR